MIKKINNYFFGVDTIKGTDGYYFYSTLVGSGAVTTLLFIYTNLINK